MELKKISTKAIFLLVGIIIMVQPLSFILKNRNYIQVSNLPKEYFDVYNYFKGNNSTKVYFPSYMPQFQSITGNYNWSNMSGNPTIYTNPFTSILPLENVVYYEGYPTTQIKQDELQALTAYSNNVDSIIQSLEYHGINYLIIDRNFLWNKNFPKINVSALQSKLKLVKKFNNIYIYKLDNRSSKCIPSYGDYSIRYCSSENPKTLINRSSLEYSLDKFYASNEERLTINKNIVYYDYIVDPKVQSIVVNKKFLIPFRLFTIEPNKDVFNTTVAKSKIVLAIPVLKYSSINSTQIYVRLGDRIIHTFSTYKSDEGVRWKIANIDINEPQAKLSIDIKGQTPAIMGEPIILNIEQWQSIKNNIDTIKTINTTKIQ
jgi:hypothetical protein